MKKSQILKFKEEIILLKELDHPNIMKFYEYFEDKRFFYLIFEDVSGNLSDYVKERSYIPEDKAIKLFYNLLEGISYLHGQKIVHKVICPTNIFL